MKLPVFSDYIKNLPKEDAEDLRFFIGNAIQPTEAPRDFCIQQMKSIRANKAHHPHLRWRAHHSLRVVKMFGLLKSGNVARGVMRIGRVNGVNIIPYTPSLFDKPAEVKLVDLTITECAGHIIFPQNTKKLCSILSVIKNYQHTDPKFGEFANIVRHALEEMFGSLDQMIDMLGERYDTRMSQAVTLNQTNNVVVLER